MNKHYTNVAIIGGGLAGILAAIRLAKSHINCILIDNSLPGSNGKLGGFAAFSGAKFSLPPAGLGLLPTLENSEELNLKISEVLSEMGLSFSGLHKSSEVKPTIQNKLEKYLRPYESLLLSPDEIQALINRLSIGISAKYKVLNGSCSNLTHNGINWDFDVNFSNLNTTCRIQAGAVFYAGGRLGSDFLMKAGAMPTQGKGLDVGVRIEVMDRSALNSLRILGPDAKIIDGKCRTFCLNVPGLIYHYPYNGIQIPGGVVAEENESLANVGLLVRVQDKINKLASIVESTKALDIAKINNIVLSGSPNDHLESYASPILGGDVVEALKSFIRVLDNESLIDFSLPYKIHMPLLDWHWDTFAKTGSHETSLGHVYVIGDGSGHARGLLQAAVSGWIAAEEYLNEEI